MKSLSKYLLILLTLIPSLSSCRSGYKEKDGKIYYIWTNGGNWTRESTLLEDADAKTFEIIKAHINVHLGKDKSHVFVDGSILEHADPNTFEQVDAYYWKDRNNVYLIQFGGKDCRIKDADPKSFKVLKNYNWSLDNNNVYFEFDKLNDANPKSFEALNENWGKDNKYYYFKDQRLDSLDYASAEIVIAHFRNEPARPSEYVKDNHHLYYRTKLVKDANPTTFKADGSGSFGHDDKYMFNREKNNGLITETYKSKYIDSRKKNN